MNVTRPGSIPTPRKTAFWWISVAGAKTEPGELAHLDGERVIYTCGCGDPFYLDRPDCLVELVEVMKRALTPKEFRAWDKKRQADNLARDGRHHWRGDR